MNIKNIKVGDTIVNHSFIPQVGYRGLPNFKEGMRDSDMWWKVVGVTPIGIIAYPWGEPENQRDFDEEELKKYFFLNEKTN